MFFRFLCFVSPEILPNLFGASFYEKRLIILPISPKATSAFTREFLKVDTATQSGFWKPLGWTILRRFRHEVDNSPRKPVG